MKNRYFLSVFLFSSIIGMMGKNSLSATAEREPQQSVVPVSDNSIPYAQPAPKKQLILSDEPGTSNASAQKQILVSNGPDIPALTNNVNTTRTTPPLWPSSAQNLPNSASQQTRDVSNSQNQTSLHPRRVAFQPFVLYSDRNPRHTHYVPSGYMGDELTMSGAYITTPRGNEGPCLKVTYSGSGPKGWAGLLWQDPANNWGDAPGRAGYDLRGATQLIFWARGENGGEKIHAFRMGGIVGSYPDSDVASIGPVKLTKGWKQYTIDLKKKDLRHIIGGFGFLVNKFENSGAVTFYLNDIYYVGPEGLVEVPAENASTTVSTTEVPPQASPVQAVTVAATSSSSSAMTEVPSAAKDLKVKQTEQGLRVSFSSQLLFTTGHANLQPSSGKILDEVIALLSAYPSNKVLIEGHTDNTGSADYNMSLSRLRAASVRDYLIKQGGYELSRFRIMGYGATHPIADNDTKEGRSLNRRVEVTILKSSNEQ